MAWRRSAAVLVSLLFAGTGHTATDETGRPWTVQDSVAVRYFVSDHENGVPGWLKTPSPSDVPVVPSPDGRHLFFVSFHGDLKNDRAVYVLAVHAVDAIKHALKTRSRGRKTRLEPLRRIVFQSAHSDEFQAAAIFRPHWENDAAIIFIGVHDDGPRRVYRLRIDSGALQALTDEQHDVLADMAQTYTIRGSSIIFASRALEPWAPLEQYPMATIRSDELWQMVEPERIVWQSYASYRGSSARLVASRAGDTGSFGPRISPNEKWAVLVYPPKDLPIPKSWLDYEVKPNKGYRFVLIDMENGTTRPVFDAPGGTVTKAGRGRHRPFDAYWSADSRHVLLFNTALPLTENREERRWMSYIVDYVPETDQWSVISPMARGKGDRVQEAEWLKEGRELLVTYESADGAALEGTIYTFHGDRWVERSAPASMQVPKPPVPRLPDGVTVKLQESANEPPVIIASDGKRTLALTEPDSSLTGIWRAHATTIQWDEGGGKTGKGLLMLPRDFEASKPVPLVIQGFRYEPNIFRPDGVVLHGFAAQALVAQGFGVLQLDLAYDDVGSTYQTPGEGAKHVERIDYAVEMLASRGIIDPARVGLIGFSRGGYSTYYTITHPGRTKLAAAVVSDSITASYGEYVNWAGLGHPEPVYEKQYGIGTFWQNKTGWLDAPAFNIDRVVTPVLFTATGKTSRAALLETIGAFRYCRRPFDYLYFSRGSHQLQRPQEREAAMQATVDWMNFWLQGKEPATSDDRPVRWQKMKTDWEKTQAEEATK